MTKNNNGKSWRFLAILLTVLFTAMGVVYGYGKLNGRFEAVETKVKKVEENRERLIRVEEGIEYIKKAMDRMEAHLSSDTRPR